MFFKKAIACVAATTLLMSCEAQPSRISPAQQIRSLSVSSFEQGLALFEQVCINDAPEFSSVEARGSDAMVNGIAIFNVSSAQGDKKLCSMRAKAPEDVDVRQVLKSRYGASRRVGVGIVTIYESTPFGPLLFQPGFVNGAGEGTYQIGIVR